VRHFRSLPVLAVRRIIGNWRLLSSVVVGTLVAGAVLASTVIYADAIRDLGLEFALEQEIAESLDVRVANDNVAIRRGLYVDSREFIDRTVSISLGRAGGSVLSQGSTATFYPSTLSEEPDLENSARPRANLRFRSELLEHTVLIEGRLPTPNPAVGTGPIEVLIGIQTARANGILLGDYLSLHPFWDDEITPITVQIVGMLEAKDPSARYWGARADVLDSRTEFWPTYMLFVSEETFLGALPAAVPSLTARYLHIYQVELGGLDSRNAQSVADSLASLEQRLVANEPLTTVKTDLIAVLRTFDDKLFFVRIPLFVLLLQIGGVAAYYLLVVSTMLIERQAAEIATLRSRGASTAQLLAQYGVEAAILASLAVLFGPPLAAFVISALGSTPAFSALSGGGPLDIHLSRLSFALAGAGALLAFLSFMVPAWQATRQTVVGFKQSAARPRRASFILRYYLDVAFVIVFALVFWRLRQGDGLFEEPLFGEPQADPLLLATPTVAMLTVGIVFLRLFPLVLQLVAWIVARGRGVALLVGTRALARNPTHYSRLILMLMFATGVGMFGATFSATLDRSFEDRTSYAVGADVRARDFAVLARQSEASFIEAIKSIPARESSPVVRMVGAVSANSDLDRSNVLRVEVLGVEPETFGEVAYFRSDFANRPLGAILSDLEENTTVSNAIPLPIAARQFGVWAKLIDIRAAMDFQVVFMDAAGQLFTGRLGMVRPGDPATEEWRFFSLDLQNIGGQRVRYRSAAIPKPKAPITMQSLFVRTRSSIGQQRGIILLGPVLTSPLPPTGTDERLFGGPALASFAGAELTHDLSGPGFEILQGTVPQSISDQIRVDADAPPGATASVRYEWFDSTRVSGRRGIRQAIDGERTLVFLSSNTSKRLDLALGDDMTLSVTGAHLQARYAGAFDLFPTFDANSGNGFALVHASRLMVDANSAVPTTTLAFNSAWFGSDDPAVTSAALASLKPRTLNDIDQERLRQEEDPLIAAGWGGILAISFAAVLLLSAIGFLIYSYLTAQQRRLEFAVLRTLGFSRRQIFGVVLLEHLFVVITGMGLGTIVGLQVGRLMMDFFGLDEKGAELLPPFALSVSMLEVALVWGILGLVFVLTVLAVVLLYFRLDLHRVLRVGDA
jgi:hypothetical protein